MRKETIIKYSLWILLVILAFIVFNPKGFFNGFIIGFVTMIIVNIVIECLKHKK